MTKGKNTRAKEDVVTPHTRKLVEQTATFGLLLVCVSLVGPFANFGEGTLAGLYKWIYASGALIYLVARLVGASDSTGSMRIRRLRRMEFWAGVAFGIGAGFWFYTEQRLGIYAGMLATMRQTILFTLVGAMIQVIASWMIYSQEKKELKEGSGE